VSALWQADAQCETQGNWQWGKPGTPSQNAGYEGGIGFAPSTWRWWAGATGFLTLYPHAYLAPARVQAYVAQYGLDRYGRWGCLFKPWVWANR
jgi:Transglycosylase-like domain